MEHPPLVKFLYVVELYASGALEPDWLSLSALWPFSSWSTLLLWPNPPGRLWEAFSFHWH